MTNYAVASPEEVKTVGEIAKRWSESTTAFNSAKRIAQLAVMEYLLNQENKTLF